MNQIPTMENTQTILSALYYLVSILLIFRSSILNYTSMTLAKFFPKYLVSVWSFTCYAPSSWQHLVKDEKINNFTTTKTETINIHDSGIKKEEVGLIMSNLSMPLSQEEEQINDDISHEEFSTFFDQMEPGLHELKEAFSIFDKNCDGFIDAKELQTVLISLGLREGTDIHACQSMIDQHDRNQDGKIDLSDFSRLIESSLL